MANSFVTVPNVLPGNVTIGGNLTVTGNVLTVGSFTEKLRLAVDSANQAKLSWNQQGGGATRDNAAKLAQAFFLGSGAGLPDFELQNSAGNTTDTALPTTIFTDYTNHQNTGNTTENTIYSKVIRANLIGANGALRIRLRVLANPDAGAGTTLRLKLGGTTLSNPSFVGVSQLDYEFIVANRNSASSQWIGTRTLSSTGAVVVTQGVSAVNTAADQTLTITLQSGNAADVQNADFCTIELMNTYGPVT